MSHADIARRSVLQGAAVGAGVTALAPALTTGTAYASSGEVPTRRRPNFVLVMTDDQGYGDLGSYGAQLLDTPVIDGLAERGIRFTDHYAGSPLCTPSRATLLSGAWPPRVNMPNVLNPAYFGGTPHGISAFETLLPEYLRTAGYATAHFGKWHLGDPAADAAYHPLEHGFDHWYGIPFSNDYPTIPVYQDRDVVDTIVYPGALGQDAGNGDEQNWLNASIFEHAIEWLTGKGDQPFLAYIAPSQPHEPVASEYQGSAGGPHGSSVEEMDMLMGRLLQRLDEMGVREDTVVVFTSDNGPWWVGDTGGLKGRKGETYDGGIKVPFVLEWPAMAAGGLVHDGITTHADVLPTFCAAAGVTLRQDRTIDGRNLLPLLETGAQPSFFVELESVLDEHDAVLQRGQFRALQARVEVAGRRVADDDDDGAIRHLESFLEQVRRSSAPASAQDALVVAVEAAARKVREHVDVAYYQSTRLNAVRRRNWKLHVRRVPNPTRHTGLHDWDADEGMPELYDLSVDPTEAYDLSARYPDRLADMRRRLEAFDASLKADLADNYPR